MKIHALRHVPYEGPGFIEEWIDEMQYELTFTLAYEKPEYPSKDDFDALIIMGGSMSVNDEELYPWLKKEKEFILNSIEAGKQVLGICLGSQLIASALGSKVYQNKTREIGWFPVRKSFEMHSWFPEFDEAEQQILLHWHGDTFELPEGAVRLFSSEATPNQGFAFGENVIALQFHPEMNEKNIRDLVDHTRSELVKDTFVQTESEILEGYSKYAMTGRKILFELLDYLIG